jgi:hypothetical protein
MLKYEYELASSPVYPALTAPVLDMADSRRAAKEAILANGGRSTQELDYLQDSASKDSRKSYPLTSAQKDK